MPISSLPSPYGIGTFGKAAYDFSDFLHAAGQGYWQLLPLGPTSYGDSPYQSFSTFAGNPYFIDLDLLIKDKLLTRKEVTSCAAGCATVRRSPPSNRKTAAGCRTTRSSWRSSGILA